MRSKTDGAKTANMRQRCLDYCFELYTRLTVAETIETVRRYCRLTYRLNYETAEIL